MIFNVIATSWNLKTSPSRGYLVRSDWDDFGYATTFTLIIVTGDGTRHDLGQVKIGAFGMSKPDNRRPNIPGEFEKLDETFFSLGQDVSYYESLLKLEPRLIYRILSSLNDVVADSSLFNKASHEQVTRDSLFRNVSETTAQGQFRRILHGLNKLTSYDFDFTLSSPANTSLPTSLSFIVKPKSNPPTNIHVIIGRNGVGKTRLLQGMTRALIHNMKSMEQFGHFDLQAATVSSSSFANLVSVTFSAFDPFDPLPDQKGSDVIGMKYYYVGLKYHSENTSNKVSLKNTNELNDDFVKSLLICLNSNKILRWQKALRDLEADPVFKDAGVSNLADSNNDSQLLTEAHNLFARLSSGHKIVLLTITRLIETVEERTLVLLDEPESHLHPPLLSAFVRALSDLLKDRNGVAIIATHSPVILQEVPSSCVWKIRRAGYTTIAERPEVETFGENVGLLTREVFGLEVTKTGFHQLLQRAIEEEGDYNSVLEYFGNELGAEARMILRALTTRRREINGGEKGNA